MTDVETKEIVPNYGTNILPFGAKIQITCIKPKSVLSTMQTESTLKNGGSQIYF